MSNNQIRSLMNDINKPYNIATLKTVHVYAIFLSYLVTSYLLEISPRSLSTLIGKLAIKYSQRKEYSGKKIWPTY